MRAIIFLSVFFLMNKSAFAFSQQDFKWTKSSQKNGLTIYKAEKHSSGLVPIRFDITLNYPPSRVLSVLADPKRKTEWVPRMIKAETISYNSEYDKIEYSIYDSPWPFDGRSFLVNIKSQKNVQNKSVNIRINSLTLPQMPVKPNLVRGFTYNGDVLLRNNTKGDTFLQVTLLTDFKGKIPKWIINVVQLGWPKEMVKNIKSQLDKKDIVVNKDFLFLD